MLIYQAGYYGLRGEAVAERADMLLERFDLASKAKQVYTKLSGGMKRRLTLARALIHEPRLVILDEPTAGVDVELRLELWSLLAELNTNGTTIILTTHYLEEAEELCDRIGIIQAGKLVALETTQQADRRAARCRTCSWSSPAGDRRQRSGRLLDALKREIVRTFSIINQVIWPPVIQTLLYVFVFGLALGSRIQNVHGVSYAQFLIPGLIMLQVIDQTYSESSSSVFQGRFMNSIQEMLIAPLSAIEMVLGYVVAGVAARDLHRAADHACWAWCSSTPRRSTGRCTSSRSCWSPMLFSSLGIIFGLLAEKFDHIAVLTTFFITPLVFVGGVFTSTQFLPPLVQQHLAVQPDVPHDQRLPLRYTGIGDAPLWAVAGGGDRAGGAGVRRRAAHDGGRLQAAHQWAAFRGPLPACGRAATSPPELRVGTGHEATRTLAARSVLGLASAPRLGRAAGARPAAQLPGPVVGQPAPDVRADDDRRQDGAAGRLPRQDAGDQRLGLVVPAVPARDAGLDRRGEGAGTPAWRSWASTRPRRRTSCARSRGQGHAVPAGGRPRGTSDFAKAYDIRNYPTTFVIDREGVLRARHADNMLPAAQLQAYIVAAQHGESARC